MLLPLCTLYRGDLQGKSRAWWFLSCEFVQCVFSVHFRFWRHSHIGHRKMVSSEGMGPLLFQPFSLGTLPFFSDFSFRLRDSFSSSSHSAWLAVSPWCLGRRWRWLPRRSWRRTAGPCSPVPCSIPGTGWTLHTALRCLTGHFCLGNFLFLS